MSIQKLEFRELTSSNEVDPLRLHELAPFTQAWFYGEWQEQLGKKVRRFAIFADDYPVLYMQLVPCPLARGKIYYTIPYGPIVKEDAIDEKVLNLLKQKLKEVMKEDHAIFTRLDFSPPKILSYKTPSPVAGSSLRSLVVHKFWRAPWWSVHGACFQPRIEWWLPLEANEEEILAGMHQKTRYNIRLAAKKGVEVEIVEEGLLNYLEDFYAVQANTARRNGFQLHEKEYYKAVLASAEENKNGYLAVSRYGGKILTVNFMINYGQIAMFAFGGSVDEHRNLMPSYAAHWAGALHAKSLGLTVYNFGGYFDKNGPRMKKETLKKRERFSIFKRKFGGQEVLHSDFYDCVGNSLWYTLYLIHKFLRHV